MSKAFRVSRHLTLENGTVILLRRSTRARRMTLCVSRGDGQVALTIPTRAPLSEARAFAELKADWLTRTIAKMPGKKIVAEGAQVPVEGRSLTITPFPLRAARIEGDLLLVPQARPAGAVVQGFIKHLAHDRLRMACDRHAANLGRPFTALVLRDTRSRWGSCTSDARLMFSWRLAMAPPEVLDYVAAHEVAHLAHMDHSPQFWAAVERLLPDFAVRRGWLRQHGNALLAWRFRD